MKHSLLLVAAAAALVVAGCANPSRSRDLNNPKVAGATLAQQVCSNCHGVTGISISPIFPKLAAQTPEYIVLELREFRSHQRADPPGFEYMWGISRSLTDRQIDELADYFSHQSPRPNPASADPRWIAAGDKIFHEGVPARGVPACLACHGADGQGNQAFPRLAGQHMDYVVKQLVIFQRTEMRPHGDTTMKPVTHELNDDNIRDVAAYVQSIAK